MPIRIVCPSCSAALSVKDEFAGRAVKCPKCGGVIPPSAQQPTGAAPPAAPPKPAFEVAEEPKPAASGTGAKPTVPALGSGSKVAKAVPAKGKVADEDEDDRPRKKRRDEEDEDDRPARRRRDDRDEEENEDRPRNRRRDEDDRDGGEDRPRKRRRRDDDDDDRPTRKEKKGGGGGLALGIIGGILLACCGGGLGLGYWVYSKAKKAKEDVEEFVENANHRVNPNNNEALQVGNTTRAQAEVTLGGGKVAAGEDLEKVFPGDAAKFEKWMPFVVQTRAVYWRNGDDFIIAAFYPSSEADARLQLKEWQPKVGANVSAGEPSNAAFLQKYPPNKSGGSGSNAPGRLTPQTKVPAEELAREFKDGSKGAAEKYVGKTFTVEGKLKDIEVVGNDTRMILEAAQGDGASQVACAMKGYLKMSPFSQTRGQQMRVEGRCVGATGSVISFTDCAVTGFNPDPAARVTATSLIAAYRTDAAGDARYKGKLLWVESGEIEKMPEDGTLIVVPFARIPGSKAPARKIRVEYDPRYKPLFSKLKVGGLVYTSGLCEGVKDGEIVIKDAWFQP
jgi:predicted Zn finger-like uncharacterized protein